MDIKEYEKQISKNIFEDREGNIRMHLGFYCDVVGQSKTSYCIDLITPGTRIRDYLVDDCQIPTQMIDDWVEKQSIQDVFLGDLFEFEGFVNNNLFARNLNRFYRASGYHVHFQKLLGINLAPGVDGVQRCLNGIVDSPFDWELEFTDRFYKAVFLHYDYTEKCQCGLFIRTYVYNFFPALVNQRLDEVNPLVDERFRRHKLHQFFKGESLRELRNHINLVTILLECSRDKIDFKDKMSRVPKIAENLALPSRNLKSLKAG